MRKIICLSLFVLIPTMALASPDSDLWSGIQGKGIATIKAALAAGANPNAKKSANGREKTPLHATASFGSNANFNQLKTVMVLIKAGADVNATDSDGEPVLFSACNRNDVNLELLELLLLKKPNVNAQESKGRTALTQLAVNSDYVNDGNLPAIKMLLDAGADPSIKDSNGKSAYDYARKADVKQALGAKMPAGGLLNNATKGINVPNIPKNIKLW